MHFLEGNLDKIDWYQFCEQEWAFPFLERNQHLIKWCRLSCNPAAMHLFEQNQDKIFHWHNLSRNPSIFELDYDFLRMRMNIIRDELMTKAWHPSRYEKWCI